MQSDFQIFAMSTKYRVRDTFEVMTGTQKILVLCISAADTAKFLFAYTSSTAINDQPKNMSDSFACIAFLFVISDTIFGLWQIWLQHGYENSLNLIVNELALKNKCERIKNDLEIMKTIFSLLM